MSDILSQREIHTLVRAALDGTPGGLTTAEMELVLEWGVRIRIEGELLAAAVLRGEFLITVPVDPGDLQFSVRVHG